MGGPGSADAIIVAAGSSTRMDGTDKLLIPIDGRPLLAHTIAALAAVPEVSAIVVVTTTERRRALEAFPAAGERNTTRITFVSGGAQRHDSVRAGFATLEAFVPDPSGERVTLVHDGARPVVSAGLIQTVIAATLEHGAAIPVVPVVETIKRIDGDRIVATVDREQLVAAQTPQGVRRTLLRQALAATTAGAGAWTDEAALLEACRIAVHVVPGDPANLKVTVPADLAHAADLLGGLAVARRTGIGHDAHPFGPGEPLRLGGIEIAGAPRLHGHSDGDVALHAVADALLGAGGLGDLGQLFPAGPATPRGIDSRTLLATVTTRLADAGWRPAALDLTITAARPSLARHLGGMRVAIADLTGLPVGAVNVKASTGNLDGADGAGRSISTLAIATIEAKG